MIRKIPVLELKKGMYIVDSHKGMPLTPPHYSVEGYILSPREPFELQRLGFTQACVDDTRYTPYPEALDEAQSDLLPPVPVNFAQEQLIAQKLYTQGIEAAADVQKKILDHKDIDINSHLCLFQEISDSLGRNINALLCLGKLREGSEYTYTHSVNVALYTVVLARALGIREDRLAAFALAGFFHDIGKLFIPQDILLHPGRLSTEQRTLMQDHPALGKIFLAHYPNLPQEVIEGALEHHERPNGSGYPKNKTDEEISLAGSLLAVADVYDALTSTRPYKKAATPVEALSHMYQNRQKDFASGFLEAFIDVLGVYPPGCFVQLNNDYYGIVTEHNPNNPTRPRAVLVADHEGKELRTPRRLDLTAHSNLAIAKAVESLPFPCDGQSTVLFAYRRG